MDIRNNLTNEINNEGIKINDKASDIIKEMLVNIPGGVIKYTNNYDKQITFITDNMLNILECSRDEFQTVYKSCLNNILFEEDIVKFETFSYSKEEHSKFEARVKTKDNNIKWVSVNLNKINNGESVDIYCIFTDIDEYKNSQENMEIENEMFKKVLNTNADIMFEYDVKKDTISFSNIRFEEGIREDKVSDFIEHILNGNSIHPEDKAKIIGIVSMDKTTEVEFRFVSLDGSIIWCAIRAISIKNKKGKNKKIIGWINNIDEKKKHEEYINDLKQKDSLTKLYNHGAVKRKIINYLENEGKNLSNAFIIIDIDNFTKINKRIGEIFGDAILINIANNIRNELRGDDLVARIGGDKYLVFLKNVEGKEQVLNCVKRIQEIIQEISIGDIKELHITCSIGVTVYPEDGNSYEELFANTDKALYYAKVYGKNRFETYQADLMEAKKDSQYYNKYGDTDNNVEYESFEQDVTSKFLDIMSKARDLREGIEDSLEMIGNKFKVSNVNIILRNKHRLKINYNWSINGIVHNKELIAIKADEIFCDRYCGYLDENNLLVVNNVKNLEKNFPAKWLFEKFNISSILQCVMKDNNEVHAVINVCDTRYNHTWTESECRALKTLALLLSSYLLKIRDSEMLEDRINEVRNNDVLTGLPTLANFKAEVKQIVKKDNNKKYSIANIDFRKFKYINDNFGYEHGDQILKEFANMINKKEFGILACCRNFSDNFIVLQEYESREKIELYLNKLSDAFIEKIKIEDPGIRIGLSIGVCIIENNYGDIMGPIDNSNIARRYAKENNSLMYFFDDEMKKKLKMEFEITNSMEMALAHNEFKVYYQPKVNISDGTIAGAEALVRWVKPDNTMMAPDSFIPLFEKNGFVVNLDFFVYEDVCKTMRDWIDNGKKVIPISVNVSRVHLYEEKSFIQNLVELVDKYKIPHELLELELTENIFIDSAETALLTMKTLKEKGFKVSIDDFGSGYSSLNLLKDMNSDVLKLDRAFFGKEKLRKEEQIIVSSIVDMAKKLDIKVLSEGVETQEQSDFLKEIECDLAQGFLFSRPIPREELEKMLNEDKVL